MKNIQVIDGADNCAYDVFRVSDNLFYAIFPAAGQNIEFMEDLASRWELLDENIKKSFNSEFWKKPQPKHKVRGIDGILFFELKKIKSSFYPNKNDTDLDYKGRAWGHSADR